MWRNAIKSFERSLIFTKQLLSTKNCFTNIHFSNIKYRLLTYSGVRRSIEAVATSQPCADDDAYIVPYKPELEKRYKVKCIIALLQKKLLLSREELECINTDEMALGKFHQKSLLNDTIDLLISEGVSKESFVQYPWLITLDKKKLMEKIVLLKSIKGLREFNDFVPFLRIQYGRLRQLVSILNIEVDFNDYGNRVYFIAEKLDVPPQIVTKYLAKRLFILQMPSDMFKKNLDHMINYKVESMNILKDLWGFRYDPCAVEQRLRRALQAKKERIMPWMVRCPEPILQKSLQINLDELQVLNGKTTVAEYVGERLGFSAEEAQAIMDMHPQVNSVRVTKIKEVLDYLLDEAKFTRHEIAQVPRILCHSLKTTKHRLEELKSFGCRPSSLIIVCRSKREYEKFLKNWKNDYKHNV